MTDATQLTLNLRRQRLKRDAANRAYWETVMSPKTVLAARTAILICDVWDDHWSRGAAERCAEIAVRMSAVVAAARDLGVSIIHAPSDTMDFYTDHPVRKRMLAVPAALPPDSADHEDPPLPIDDSDGGSDTGEKPWHKAWSRQHPAIEIADQDVISDKGQEVYSFLRQRDIAQVAIMGVHTNMCVLHRSFGIKQMVRWGVSIALARDLTDTMYNPEMRPYVSHDEGTRLVIEFIEKYWCPTVVSEDVTKAR
jgi:nicotinamidase-related amidase